MFSASMSPSHSTFAPLLFSGRLEEGLETLPKAGFSAVEISLRRAEDVDAGWLEKRTSDLGLEVSAFASGRLCLEDSLCLSDTNPIVRNQIFERLRDIVMLAAHFHSSVIIGGVRGKLSGEAGQKEAQINAAVDTLRRISNIACDLGVCLLIEPINHYETNFINTADEGIELIENIGQPCVRLLLDTYHMNIEESNSCATIYRARKYLGYIHFADNNRQAPGQGQINFQAIFDVLAAIGYHGFITTEILPIPDDLQALYRAGKYLHSLKTEKKGNQL
jgi:5-keto-L-gluconate epimerase